MKSNENIKKNNVNSLKINNDENIQNKSLIVPNLLIKNCNNNYNIKKKDLLESDKIKIKEKTIYLKNPIEEYNEVIMENLFISEINNRPDYKKLSEIISKSEIANRFSCLNLAISLGETFEFRQETIYLTINLFDRFLLYLKLSNKLETVNLRIVLLSCIFIASKYEEIYPPIIDDYLELFLFSKDDIFKYEYEILEFTKFELHICSPYLFLTIFFDIMKKHEPPIILYAAQFIMDICIMSLEFCIYKPSFQAAISLYLSKIFINNNLIYKVKLWTNEDKYVTGYSEEEIKRNLKIALNIIKQFFSGNIIKDITKTALFKKYKNIKYLEVANILKDLIKF